MSEKKIVFKYLPDGRSCLPVGTIIDLGGSGGRYRITGDPVGYGGSGILYPAVTMKKNGEDWEDGKLRVALKECFPAGTSPVCSRTQTGEITGPGEESQCIYTLAGKMLHNESEVTGKVYTKGFRLTPILHSADEEIIILPNGKPHLVHNAVGILERLDEKGRPFSEIISEKMSGWQCFHLFGLVLRALKEVHSAGFLHGDIQEHNIFVKGWEEDESSCEITLTDFGSARALLEDGATDVIRDRMLFTTKGYAAPECQERNDGTLRLTPAADLYSAGVLLMRMLNGRLPERHAIQLVVGGRYFLQRRAKQIGVASGTVPKINEVLTGLLQPDPNLRYQTVQEVLEICERIEHALTPKTSALEAIDYDAFISYTHEEISMAAAQKIQKKLEKYRIPKTVIRPDGRTSMKKVFRDQTELTAGGDLENHIRSALAHSAFLIVILTPGAKGSP